MCEKLQKLDSMIRRLDDVYQDISSLELADTLGCYQFELSMREAIKKAGELRTILEKPGDVPH